jgi:hypothetical protein
MSTEKKYKTLKDFYPYYLTEHQDKRCQAMHFIGTGILLLIAIAMFATQTWWFFFLIPLVGYGFAWIGHFVFEKNKPATFQYPGFSLASDFIMFYHILTGQIDRKVAEARKVIHGAA